MDRLLLVFRSLLSPVYLIFIYVKKSLAFKASWDGYQSIFTNHVSGCNAKVSFLLRNRQNIH